MLELLRSNRDFRRLFLATVVSLGGDWFSFVAVADLVTELTGRPGAAAFVYAAVVLPVFLASPLAGAAADRYDRKRILVISDLCRVPLALLLIVAAAMGSVTLAITAVIALGIGASFYDPVVNAATPNLVPPEQLATAQAAINAVWGSMLFVGASLGGIVAELAGRNVAFAIDAASFLVSALLVAGISRPLQEASAAERRAHGGRIRDVIAFARGNRIVGRLLLAKLGASLANGVVGLLPALARERFGGASIATGALLAARGLGALLGPFVALAVFGKPTLRSIVLACFVSTMTYCAFYAALPIAPVLPVAAILVVLAHLGGGAQWTLSTIGLQDATPDRMRGRVLAFDYGLATLAIGASSIAAGILAEVFSTAIATWVLSAIGAVYGVGWWLATRRAVPA